MERRMRAALLRRVFLVALGVTLAAPVRAELPKYQMKDLGTPGGVTSLAPAINETGQGSGYADLADGASEDQPMVDLGTLGGEFNEGSAINAAGTDAGLVGAAIFPGSLLAEPVIDYASILIDKPDYSGGYAIGVSATVKSAVSVTSVTVVHTPVSSGSAGEWALANTSEQRWWSWSSGRPPYSEGPLDGTFSITATDELGGTSVVKEITVPADAELEFPTMQVTRTTSGYEVAAQPVTGADFYYLWLWDPEDGFYPSSQQVTDPATLVPISTANLVPGRTYRLFFIAVNQLDVGQFRSYTLQYITYIPTLALKANTVAGCKSVLATVTLHDPAPPEGVRVTLGNSLSSASIPASVTISAGSTSKSFAIKTTPVTEEESGTISATIGDTTLTQNLTVRPMGLMSLTLTPTTVAGSNQVIGTAKLECKSGPGPITVDLTSSNPAVANPVAASIVVPQAMQSTTFVIATNAVQSKSSSIIEATANGTKKSKTLTVTPAASVAPTSLKFGNQTVNTSATLVTTLYNKGTAAFTVNGISLGGTSPQFYKLSNNCPAILSAGASCAISVTFTSTIAAFRSAKLAITTSATSAPLSVLLGGTGVLTPP